ncbi:MAG: thrombospondin type 3 repeat-containing protein [Archangium sp.]
MLALIGGSAIAQERGFTAQRFDASAVGSRLFLLDRPWYSSTRYFAGGVTADYAHRVLVPQIATGRASEPAPIIDSSVVGTVELAGSFLDRVRIAAALPVTFLERGSAEIVSGSAPLMGVGVGDPRLGVMVRLFGDAERDAFSAHLGADVWIPIGGAARHQGELGVRFMPRFVLAGSASALRWTFEGAYLLRPVATIGPPALGLTAAPELRLGLGLHVALFNDSLFIGPEARMAAQVVGPNAFTATGMSVDLLGGASVLIADSVMVGVAGGTGLMNAAGTPDFRGVVRVAWAPRAKGPVRMPTPDDVVVAAASDVDGDGVPDGVDRCPLEPEDKNGVRELDGCPEFSGDAGVVVARLMAVSVAGAADASVPLPSPLPASQGEGVTPALDSDSDGVDDWADRCPVTAEDPDGFEDEDGCPELDNDNDGFADATDSCAFEAETRNGFKDDDGCPDVAPDEDKDGIADAIDRCPLEPETIDGFRDEDGCPEFVPVAGAALASAQLAHILAPLPPRVAEAIGVVLDTDKDGVDDRADRCPVTSEDLDGFEDEDGCPELDQDEDGIPDRNDLCPLDAETLNGWKDEDGCPDEHGDVDGDGVEYAFDRCPLEPGDRSDGCPHLPPPALALAGFSSAAPRPSDIPPGNTSTADFDKDGAPDDADKCPMSAEDKDGFEDDDGCPEPDNDADGVDDSKDKCPFEAETINGNRDEDGCPDPGPAKVHVRKGMLVLDESVQFKSGSAALLPASNKLLKQVAAVLRGARAISIEIQGHTDDVGSASNNIKLSKQRAEAIRSVLLKEKIAPLRLRANGYGPTRPRASNATAEGREQNRRVDFLIIGEAK